MNEGRCHGSRFARLEALGITDAGQTNLALAAYNMGPGALRRLQAAYPHLSAAQLIQQHAPAETAGYVSRILRRYRGR